MDFTDDLENCLEALRYGQLVGISSPAGYLLAADALNKAAIGQLLGISRNRFSNTGWDHFPVILLADERSYLQHISALDLAVFDWMAGKTGQVAVWFGGIIGINEELMTSKGEASLSLVHDEFALHLVKRLRNPLVVIPVDKEMMCEYAEYVSSYSCAADQHGFTRLRQFE